MWSFLSNHLSISTYLPIYFPSKISLNNFICKEGKYDATLLEWIKELQDSHEMSAHSKLQIVKGEIGDLEDRT